MDRLERMEEIMNEFDYGWPEHLAVEGLITGITEELYRLGIEREHELFEELFEEINNSYTIRK